MSSLHGGGSATADASASASGDKEAAQTSAKDGRTGAYILGGDDSPQKRRKQQQQQQQQQKQQQQQMRNVREEELEREELEQQQLEQQLEQQQRELEERELEEQQRQVSESEMCRTRMLDVLMERQAIFDDATASDPLTYRGSVKGRVQSCMELHVRNSTEYIDQREYYLEELGRARKAASRWSRDVLEQGEKWLLETVDGAEAYYEGLVESLLLDIENVDATTMERVFEARAQLTMDWAPRSVRSGSRAFGGGLVVAEPGSPLARSRAHIPSSPIEQEQQPPPSYDESHDHTPASPWTGHDPPSTPSTETLWGRALSSSPGSLDSPRARSRGTPGTFDTLGLARREMDYVAKETELDVHHETDPRYINAVSRIIGDSRDESAVTIGTWMARYCARIGENRSDTLDCIGYILTGKGGCPVGSRQGGGGGGVARGREDVGLLDMSMQSQMSGMTELDEDAGDEE
jgi:hypothetical protein